MKFESGSARVVERLVSQAAGERAMTEYGNDRFFPSREIPRNRHAVGGRHAGARVARAEGVVLRFAAHRKARDSAAFFKRVKPRAASRQQFVNVGLVAHVPQQFVGRQVQDAMKCERQFDHAEIGSEMPAVARARHDQHVANLASEVVEILAFERFNVGRRVDVFEKQYLPELRPAVQPPFNRARPPREVASDGCDAHRSVPGNSSVLRTGGTAAKHRERPSGRSGVKRGARRPALLGVNGGHAAPFYWGPTGGTAGQSPRERPSGRSGVNGGHAAPF